MLYVYYIPNIGNGGKSRLGKVGTVKCEVESENFHIWGPMSGIRIGECEMSSVKFTMAEY